MERSGERNLRIVVAMLLVLSTAAFVVGRQIERAEERRTEGAHTEEGAPAEAEPTPPEGAEAEGEHEGAEGEHEEEHGGGLFGVNTDDPELTVVGVILSLLVAADVALRGSRSRLWFALLFALIFTGLDLLWELRRQIDKSNEKIVVAAAVIAVLHLAVAAAAGVSLRRIGQPARSA